MALYFSLKSCNSLIYLKDLLYELIRRELKVQYEGTLLGFAWSLVIPFLHLGIFYFLFKVILEVNINRFTTFAFTGIISYGWFQTALTSAAAAASANRELVLRPQFPSAVLPVVSVASSMIHFIFSLPILLLIVFFEEHRLSPVIFLMPLVMIVQFLLSLGIGYMVAILNILFRDTRHILEVLLRLFYFISPVFYEPRMVPQRYIWLYELNPLVTILQSYRDIIYKGVLPQWPALGIVALISVLSAWIGWRIFQRQSHRFLEAL